MPGGLPAVIILIVATLGVGALAIYANLAHGGGAGAGAGRGARLSGRRARPSPTGEPATTQPAEAAKRPAEAATTLSGGLINRDAGGTYACACCGNKLFFSGAKVAGGQEEPCFRKPLAGAVFEIIDISYGQVRTDVICSRCQTRLGYLSTRGGGYFINPTALDFVS